MGEKRIETLGADHFFLNLAKKLPAEPRLLPAESGKGPWKNGEASPTIETNGGEGLCLVDSPS